MLTGNKMGRDGVIYKGVGDVSCPVGRNPGKINKENPWSLPAMK